MRTNVVGTSYAWCFSIQKVARDEDLTIKGGVCSLRAPSFPASGHLMQALVEIPKTVSTRRGLAD